MGGSNDRAWLNNGAATLPCTRAWPCAAMLTGLAKAVVAAVALQKLARHKQVSFPAISLRLNFSSLLSATIRK
jgi:hypothetical protein